MQPGWSSKRKRLSGYSDIVGANSYAEELWARQKNEEFMRQENQRLIETGVLNPDGTEKPERNPLQKFGDFVGSIPGAIVEGTVKTYRTAGEIGGNILAEATGVNKQIEDNLQSMADGDLKMLQLAISKSKDLNLTEEQRQRWAALKDEYSAKYNESSAAVTENLDKTVERYDPTKAAFAVAEVGLDVITAGTAGAIARGGRGVMKAGQLATKARTAENLANPKLVAAAQKAADSRVQRSINKVINPAGLKQSLASGATLGVGYGITGTGVEMGSEATAGDFAQGALMGAAFGTALGGSVNLLGRAGRKAFSEFKDNSTNTKGAMQRLIAEAPEEVVNNPEFTERITAMEAESRNVRELKQNFNEFVNTTRREAQATEEGMAAYRKSIEQGEEPLMLESGVPRQRIENDEALARLQAGEDASVYDYTDVAGNDVGETARYYDEQISDIDSQLRAARSSRNQLQRQAEGVDENTGLASGPGAEAIDSTSIRRSDLSTGDARRSPEVTPDEFQSHREAGREKMEKFRSTKAEPRAIKDSESWSSMVDDAYSASRDDWGGETYNAQTGEKVAKDADAYALTIRDEGMDTVSVSPGAGKAEFRKAMNQAKKKYSHILESEGAHLGVFNDADTGRIDIDPVLITSKLEDVHDIGAYTRATGGAYHFKSGDGFWPPHVADEVNPAEFTGDVYGRASAQEGASRYEAEIADLQARKDAILQEQTGAFEQLGGVSRTINTARARERFNQLNSQRAAIDAAEDAMQNTTTEVQKQLDDIDSGIIPDELIVDRPPAETAEEAIRRSMKVDIQDSIGLQRAYQQNQALREEAQDGLSRLVTTEKYERFVGDLNENYKLKQEEIKDLPDPMRKEEQSLLDEDYIAQVADMRSHRDADHIRVEELNQAIEVLDDVDRSIVDAWNSMEQSNPSVFGDVDPAAMDLYRESLLQRKAELEIQEKKNFTNSPIDKSETIDIAIQKSKSRKELSEQLKNQDMLEFANDVMLDNATVGKGDVNALDTYVRAPITWLRKKAGSAGNILADVIEEAFEGRRMFNGDLQARHSRNHWAAAMKKDYMGQSIKFLDEGAPITRGAQETTQHFERRQQALTDIKEWFKTTGRELGLPEDMLARNYLPHLIKREGGQSIDKLAEAMAALNSKTGLDAKGKKFTQKQLAEFQRTIEGFSPQTQQYVRQRRLYEVGDNGFLKKRTGADDWETDLETIIGAYARAAVNEIHMKPALKKAQVVANKFRDKERRLVDEIIGTISKANVEPTGAIAKSATVARRVQNMALMGASARTIMLQLDGGTRVLTEAGLRPFLQSSLRAFNSMNRNSKLMQEVMQMGGLEDSFPQLLMKSGGLGGAMNQTEKVMYAGIAAVDTHMRVWAYDAGKRAYAKKIGKKINQLSPEEELLARRAGVDTARKSQFVMDELNIPIKQNTEAGKFLTQIQQFNLSATKYNLATIRGATKDPMKLARLVAGYAGMFATMTTLSNEIFGEEVGSVLNPLGFEMEDILPFGEQVMGAYEIATGAREWGDFDVPTTPLLSFMFGSSYGDGLTDYISTAAKYSRGEIDQREYDIAMSNLPSFLMRNILPAGTQVNRSLEGYDTMQQGESINRYGNTRFLIESNSGWNLAKALIGGQYATDEGQAWIRNGINTISSRHKVTLPDGSKISVSQYARSLAPEDQAQYIGYYQTKQIAEKELEKNGMGRDSVVTGLRDKIGSGQMSIAQAQLEAQRWNDRVRMLYGPYLNGSDSIPPRLVDDFTNGVMIDVTSFERMRGMSTSRMQQLNSYYE